MKIIGVLLVIFGIIDFAGAEFNDFDVWYEWFGIELPEILWMLSPWIESGLGIILFRVGGGNDGDEE